MLLGSKSWYWLVLAFSTVVHANLHSTNEPQAEELCLPHIYACVFPLHTLHSCRAFLEQKTGVKSLET